MQSPALLKNAQTAQQGSKSTAEVYVSYYLLTADCFSVFQRRVELSQKEKALYLPNTTILEKDNFCLDFSAFLSKLIGNNFVFLPKRDDP